MDLQTAVAILDQQANQMVQIANVILQQAVLVSQLANMENNSIPDPEGQIKSFMGSMNIQMTALNSQDVLVQQAIDKVAEIVNAAS